MAGILTYFFRPAEKSSSMVSRIFGTKVTKPSDQTPTIGEGKYESESGYLSGEDDDAFEEPDSAIDDRAYSVSYSVKKQHLVDQSEQYSRKTFQAFPNTWKIPTASPNSCRSPPPTLRPEQSPSSTLHGGLVGRTQSTLCFEDELDLQDEEEKIHISDSVSESEEAIPRSKKRMLISFKEEREQVVVWSTVSIESLPNTYVFYVGDVVYLENGVTVGTIVKMLDDVHNYRVQIRDSGETRDVSHTELEHCIKIIVKHPTEEQIVFFETCEKPNPNCLKTASSSFPCASPKKGENQIWKSPFPVAFLIQP